jgi:hypothetical protein
MMGHRALRECFPPRSPVLFISAIIAFFILSFKFSVVPAPTVVSLVSPPAHTPSTHGESAKGSSGSLYVGPHRIAAPSSGTKGPLAEEQPKQEQGLAPWMRYFNSTPIHIYEPNAPSDDALFNGVLPRFWTSRSDGDERVDGARKPSKPDTVDKIIGLVFYGRRERVSILECYLRVREPWGFTSGASLTEPSWAAKSCQTRRGSRRGHLPGANTRRRRLALA